MRSKTIETDYLIIGSGLAGLFAAYNASKYGSVTVITKSDYKVSSSWFAQGGIAAALSQQDSTELHFNDTITAGRGLCDKKTVQILVEEGKEAVEELINIGMEFDKVGSEILFGLEGGHSHRRILHASGSATGQQVVKFLIDIISSIPNIDFHFNTQAIHLIENNNRIFGAYAVNLTEGTPVSVHAKYTIIASGGYSRIFSRSTNPDSAIGEGIWLAQNAGAEIRDMEFIQFHPTAFYSESGKTFLISEAVRGEGARLLNINGERFMDKYHNLGELAPRDVVSKSIFSELKQTGSEYVYLDLRHLPQEKILNRFGNIAEMLKEQGLDMTKDLIPVAPAAHYSIGGIKTDEFGRTNLANLYACGECASTGVHGANRLASNSLLECLVFAKRAVNHSISNQTKLDLFDERFLDDFHIDKNKLKQYSELQQDVAELMNSSAGILRKGEELSAALSDIEKKYDSIDANNEYYSIISKGLLNLCRMILRAANSRSESRGGHQREDYPKTDDNFLGHFLFINDDIKFEVLNGKQQEFIEMGETVN